MCESPKTPPPLARDTLRVTPLGGHGDIGRNMSSFEINGDLLFIDCGVLFPSDDHPGVDLILPGLDLVEDRLDQVRALVLTHGHEDHIGAVPYLLRRRSDIPVLGSRLTLALVRAKLREHRIRTSTCGSWPRGTGSRSASSTWSSWPSTTPSPTAWRWCCAPGPACVCTPATSRWTSFRSMAGRPT